MSTPGIIRDSFLTIVLWERPRRGHFTEKETIQMTVFKVTKFDGEAKNKT